MLWIYNTGILFYALAARILALFNVKARHFVEGRHRIFERIADKINVSEKHTWFHFASLGEFEQGRPLLEAFKSAMPDKKIIITFFSPSGYEIRKDYTLAEAVFYLPLDTRTNAKRFIALINPEMVVFTKYEFWHHYFNTLHQQKIPLYIISGIFRKNQVFFKWYGGFSRRALRYVTWFFVQNAESTGLLRSIGIEHTSVSGDTRFDRVAENAAHPREIAVVRAFCGHASVLVCGSTWPEDEKLLSALPEQYPDWKFIIAPHEIGEDHIQQIETSFSGSIRYSALNANKTEASKVLIVDNIGMLSALYQYGQMAYIGGGFGAGIHNTLEAAAFGLPVIFGPKYEKFQEARALITVGAAESISEKADLLEAFEKFQKTPSAAIAAKKYVQDHTGATAIILNKIIA